MDLSGVAPTQTPDRTCELPAVDDRAMTDIWLSSVYFPALAVADELALFSQLECAPATAKHLADTLSLSQTGAEALLGALAALGFLVQHAGRFHLTPLARAYLLPQSPYYYGPVLRFMAAHPVTAATLRDSLRPKSIDQTVVVDGQVLMRQWQAAELPADLAGRFTAMMHALSFPGAIGAARGGDFAGVHRLLDVAGGSGCFSIALALRHPELRCTVLELPTVCPIAARYVTRFGLEQRIETYAANMFADAWPADHDAVFFSNIFHDWDRPSCHHLARRAFAALPPGGSIYIHEILLADSKDGPLTAAIYSLHMARVGLGKQYSAEDLGNLLGEAGFDDVSVTPTYGSFSLVRAIKP